MKVEKGSFTFQPLSEDHLEDLQYIFLNTFRKRVSVDYLFHKYNTAHLSITPVATIAYQGNRPAAFYGAVPQQFLDGDKVIRVAHACDSFTLPAFQRQGLHHQLALLSYDIMRSQDIKMVYAYHSANTYRSTKKLGWESHLHMRRFHLKTGMPPMAKVIKKLGWNHRLIDRASRLLEPYLTTQVSNPLLAERKIAQVYDDAFFQYKDGFNTHFLVQLEHCVFYLKIDAIMQIGFFDYPEISDLQKGLKALKRVATKLGCNEILFQVNPDTRQHQGLSTVLADQQSWLIGYLWLQNPLQINAFGFNFADLDTY